MHTQLYTHYLSIYRILSEASDLILENLYISAFAAYRQPTLHLTDVCRTLETPLTSSVLSRRRSFLARGGGGQQTAPSLQVAQRYVVVSHVSPFVFTRANDRTSMPG